jgi:hypothetical protein
MPRALLNRALRALDEAADCHIPGGMASTEARGRLHMRGVSYVVSKSAHYARLQYKLHTIQGPKVLFCHQPVHSHLTAHTEDAPWCVCPELKHVHHRRTLRHLWTLRWPNNLILPESGRVSFQVLIHEVGWLMMRSFTAIYSLLGAGLAPYRHGLSDIARKLTCIEHLQYASGVLCRWIWQK